MEKSNDFIAFDVDETLYFEYGQEISEMLSISLDPDVSLDMYEAYIQIRGIIVLNGAYRKVDKDHVESKNDTLKYIEKIVETDNQEAEFYHRFPIDISIPKERVNHMEGVNVMIAAFDYELHDHQTLKIKATIHINGLAEQTKPDTLEKIENTETIDNDVANNQIEQPPENNEQLKYDETNENIEDEKDRDDTQAVLEETDMEKQQEIDISLSKTEESEEMDEVKDVRFLTELFGNTEETMQTTVTLYITQEEDTIEKIAKRFEMPTLQLIKDNDLSGEKITNGQLIHIKKH